MDLQAGPDLSVQGKNGQSDGGAGLPEFGGHFRNGANSCFHHTLRMLIGYHIMRNTSAGKPVTSYVRAALTSEKKYVCRLFVLLTCCSFVIRIENYRTELVQGSVD